MTPDDVIRWSLALMMAGVSVGVVALIGAFIYNLVTGKI